MAWPQFGRRIRVIGSAPADDNATAQTPVRQADPVFPRQAGPAQGSRQCEKSTLDAARHSLEKSWPGTTADFDCFESPPHIVAGLVPAPPTIGGGRDKPGPRPPAIRAAPRERD